MQQRRDTAANWTSNDPTLAAGEIGVETDTLRYKVGDGSTAWTSLRYAAVGSNVSGITGADVIANIVSLTQAEYDDIATPDASTLYVITD